MAFHLEGPWLTTTGKKRGPRKWASAEHKRRAEQLEAEWQSKLEHFKDMAPHFSSGRVQISPRTTVSLAPQYPPGREPQQHIPSRPDSPGAIGARPADKVYTGTKIKGIGTMHKSNAVPIFSDQEAQDISKMRR